MSAKAAALAIIFRPKKKYCNITVSHAFNFVI